MPETTKTTVYLDATDYRRLQALALAQGRTAAELVREAVSIYAKANLPERARPVSVGAGRSGRGDIAENAERLLEGFGDE
jgi:hypothetical protein